MTALPSGVIAAPPAAVSVSRSTTVAAFPVSSTRRPSPAVLRTKNLVPAVFALQLGARLVAWTSLSMRTAKAPALSTVAKRAPVVFAAVQEGAADPVPAKGADGAGGPGGGVGGAAPGGAGV